MTEIKNPNPEVTENTEPVPNFYTMPDSFSETDYEEAAPLTVAPKGEYTLCLTGYMEKDNRIIRRNKSGGLFIMPTVEIVNHADSESFKSFSHYLELPGNQEGKARKQVLFNFKTWCKILGANPRDNISWADYIGTTFEAAISVKEDVVYGASNKIDQFLGA